MDDTNPDIQAEEVLLERLRELFSRDELSPFKHKEPCHVQTIGNEKQFQRYMQDYPKVIVRDEFRSVNASNGEIKYIAVVCFTKYAEGPPFRAHGGSVGGVACTFGCFGCLDGENFRVDNVVVNYKSMTSLERPIVLEAKRAHKSNVVQITFQELDRHNSWVVNALVTVKFSILPPIIDSSSTFVPTRIPSQIDWAEHLFDRSQGESILTVMQILSVKQKYTSSFQHFEFFEKGKAAFELLPFDDLQGTHGLLHYSPRAISDGIGNRNLSEAALFVGIDEIMGTHIATKLEDNPIATARLETNLIGSLPECDPLHGCYVYVLNRIAPDGPKKHRAFSEVYHLPVDYLHSAASFKPLSHPERISKDLRPFLQASGLFIRLQNLSEFHQPSPLPEQQTKL